MKIYAPNPDYQGTDQLGPLTLAYTDGVAEVDDLPDTVRSYLQSAGYGIGSKAAEPDTDKATPPDPRDFTDAQQVGTTLRDAAVDPSPDDFLPPLHAGEAGEAGNPHGPNVVAPGIHALEGKPVVPGPVGKVETQDTADGGTVDVVVSDTDRQQERESELAERTLIGDEPVPDVTQDMGDSLAPADSVDDEGGDTKPARGRKAAKKA